MEQKKATLHAKIGVLNFGGKKAYTTQAKRSIIKAKGALTKNQEAAVMKKANDMMRKYNAMNNQKQPREQKDTLCRAVRLPVNCAGT